MMPATLDQQMETASQALAELDYTQCESLCMDALIQARDASDWVMYQRVLLPLQEARRQRRQAALDGPIRLGLKDRPADIKQLIPTDGNGCLVLNNCCDALDISNINAAAGESFELLYADNPIDAPTWTIQSTRNAVYTVEVPAPDPAWRDQWINDATGQTTSPRHWFMQASEALGNAALATVQSPMGTVDRVRDLEQALYAAGDHELLHQALADAARALHEAKR